MAVAKPMTQSQMVTGSLLFEKTAPRIHSLEKKPTSGMMPTSASEPIRKETEVRRSWRQSPP
jgi:hypothetical protein